MIDREQFAGYLAVNGLTDNTIRVYTAMSVRWVDWATTNGRDPYKPDPLSVRAWSKTVTGTRASLAHARSAISWWCRACQSEDVSATIPLPRKGSTAKPLLNRDQTIQLLATADTAGLAGLAVKVAVYTAGRRSEVASLKWSNVDFAGGWITLIRPKVRDLHRLPLHPALAADLEQRSGTGEDWVFPGRHGGHIAPATCWKWIGTVAQQAGIGHVTPHMLRRTSLTEINDATKDLRAAQLFAGHSRPETTALYTRVSDERLASAAAALNWAS